MLKSSLLEILRTFTKQELIKFEDFVRSPYFNKKENVIKLFLEIKKFASGFEDDNLDREVIWKLIFPLKEYNYGIMKNLIFDLAKLCESFLCEEIYNDNEMQRSQDLLISLSSRNKEIFQNKIESTKRTFRKNFETNNYIFTHEFYKQFGSICELNVIFSHNHKTQNKNPDDLRFATEFISYDFLLNCFRLFQKLMTQNLGLNKSPVDNIVFKLLKKMDSNLMLQEILDYSYNTSIKDHKILKVNYLMYKAFTKNENREAYNEFKNYLSENSSYFSNEEVKTLHISLLSCLTNLKITTLDFHSEYFSIIESGFENNVVLNRDGTITPDNFTSIVNVASAHDKLEFVEKFISDYLDKLPQESRESLFNYSMALLNFFKKNFEKSLEFIIKLQTNDLMLKFDIKNIQLSIYYELNDRVSFDYSIDSFRHFIRKNNLSNESRVIVLTKYSDYVNRFFKLREKPNAFELAKLKKEITDNKATNKNWLLKKIEELENAK